MCEHIVEASWCSQLDCPCIRNPASQGLGWTNSLPGESSGQDPSSPEPRETGEPDLPRVLPTTGCEGRSAPSASRSGACPLSRKEPGAISGLCGPDGLSGRPSPLSAVQWGPGRVHARNRLGQARVYTHPPPQGRLQWPVLVSP